MSFSIKELSFDKYEVFIQAKISTKHKVLLKDEYYKKLTREIVTKKELICFSIKFLLNREANTSILKSFDLYIISSYFENYEEKVNDWCMELEKRSKA